MTLSHISRRHSYFNTQFATLFFHFPQSHLLPKPPNGTFQAFNTTQLPNFTRGHPTGRARSSQREQVCFSCGRSLPMSRMLHYSSDCSVYYSCCQISSFLPLPISRFGLQEKLLRPGSGMVKYHVSSVPFIDFQGKCAYLNVRVFACEARGDDDYKREDGSEDESVGDGDDDKVFNVQSSADPEEVDRVCKVIDELFALDRNMEAVLDECCINLSHDLVVDVLERFKHARKPAFRFFVWAEQRPGFAHDSRTYNKMMSILGRTRQFETMVSLLEEMGERGLLTLETFSIAIKAFATSKERKKAVGIFDLMKKYKFKVGVDTINFLLDALGREKLGKEAKEIFEKLKDRFTHNLQTYTVLLNGWCRVKNLMEAGKVWNEMIDKGFKPDIVAHNIMLEGLFKCKKRSDAIKLFEVMKAKGPSPNVRSYTIMIRDLCKQSKLKEAVEYFNDMIKSGCPPDVAIYTNLIVGFGNQKKMDMVYELLKEMKDNDCVPDGKTYNAMIKLMTSRHMPDDAVRIYKKMVQNGVEPSIHTYNMIMKSFFQTRNYDMGRAVWDEMNRNGCCPDDNSYTVFIGGLISQGRSGEACKYLEEMIEKGMKAPQLDYNKFAADFSRAGKPEILEEMAQKMKFAGKFEVSNVFSRWAEMMKKRVKRRGPIKPTASHDYASNGLLDSGLQVMSPGENFN